MAALKWIVINIITMVSYVKGSAVHLRPLEPSAELYYEHLEDVHLAPGEWKLTTTIDLGFLEQQIPSILDMKIHELYRHCVTSSPESKCRYYIRFEDYKRKHRELTW